LTTAQLSSLSTANMVALTTTQAKALTSAQVSALTSSQWAVMETADLAALSTGALVAISTANLSGLSTAKMAALTTTQIAALTTAQMQGLNTSQVVALSTMQAAALKSSQLGALSTTQFAAMETADLAALNTAALKGVKATQINALDSSQLIALTMAAGFQTPIVLDLNGDGVRTQSITAGVKFDLLAQGQAVNTGWVSPTDGLLVRDVNHDGVINNGSELFGSSTVLANGQKAHDGYQALSELDSNLDGVIDSQDASFNDLRVWVDANSDGVTDQGEIKTLADLKISQLSLKTTTDISLNNGNILGLNGSYQTTDGATHAAADVWFQVDLGRNVSNLTQAMADFGSAQNAMPSANGLLNSPFADTAALAKAQITQSAATDLIAKIWPTGRADQGILGVSK